MLEGQFLRRFVLTCVVVTGGSALLTGCFGDKPTKAPSAPPPPVVNTLAVYAQSIPYTETFHARLEAKDRVSVLAQVNGQVRAQHFTPGDVVRAGQSLFQLDASAFASEVDALKAQIRQAQTAQNEAKRQWTRAQGLRAANAITEQAFEQAHDAVLTTKARLDALVAQQKAATLNLAHAQVQAPISGVVSEALVKVGDLVGAYQTPLTTIEGTDRFEVKMSVPAYVWLQAQRAMREGTLQRVEPMTFTMTLPDGEVYPLQGDVYFRGVTESPSTGSLDWRGLIQNDAGRLHSGMFVSVTVTLGQASHVYTVPQEVVMRDPKGEAYVYVLDNTQKVARRPVKTQAVYAQKAVITEGLQDGDRVITSALIRLRPGMVVSPSAPTTGAPSAGGSPTPKAPTTPTEH